MLRSRTFGATALLVVLGGGLAARREPTAAPPARAVPAPRVPASPAPRPADPAPVVEASPLRPAPRPPVPSRSGFDRFDRFPEPALGPADWSPPPGPIRIGLQAGHWRAAEAPEELSGLKDNGTRWRDLAEWEVNLAVAERTRTLLEEAGYEVDLLPAVVPPGYRAHLFIALHADGSDHPDASGYRVGAPRRDLTGRAEDFAAILEHSYGEATGLRRLPAATRRMRNYYAFNYRRYEHALHPMTIGVILETGFLTSAVDRAVIVDDPERVARGIVDAVRAFPVTRREVASAPAR